MTVLSIGDQMTFTSSEYYYTDNTASPPNWFEPTTPILYREGTSEYWVYPRIYPEGVEPDPPVENPLQVGRIEIVQPTEEQLERALRRILERERVERMLAKVNEEEEKENKAPELPKHRLIRTE